MKNKLLIVLASGLVVLSVLACSLGGGTSTPTTQPPVNPPVNPPVSPPSNALEVLATSSFFDDYGWFYIFGEVMNNSNVPLVAVELTIEIRDAGGASLLKDDDGNIVPSLVFYPMLYTIGVGESSPFVYYFDTTVGQPATYTVTVSAYEATEATRGELQAENVQMIDDGSGYFYLSGELVNLSNEWVHIRGLAGGALDDANTVLSADWTGTYTTLLAPAGNSADRNRTPFIVSFPIPPGNVTQWSLWWDVDVETNVVDHDLQITVTNTYFDEYDSVHLVGFVTNNTNLPLETIVVAGLYADDGTCLDADYAYLPYAVQPGKSAPFDISYFSNVNYNAEQAALVSSYTVQIDPWNTYEPYYNSVSLTNSDENIKKDGSYWTVTGNFTNTSDKNITGATVVVMVFDPEGTLAAMSYQYLYPTSDFFAPGSGKSYEVYLYLDPSASTAGYTTQTIVMGEYSQ